MALAELVIQVVGYILTHIPEILQAGLMLFAALVKSVGDTWTQLDERLAELVENADQAIIDAAGGMLNAAGEWFMGLLDGARQKAEELLDWVRGIPDRVLGALGDLGNLLLDAGKSILDGLRRGMETAWNNMTGWIGGIADEIAKLKGPLPYDKKVLIENGQALMQGLRGGLADSFENDVIPYVSAMADEMQKSIGMPTMSLGMTATREAEAQNPVGQARGGIELHVHVEGRPEDDWGLIGTRVGEAAAYELRMQGVSA
jgi:phage-related protein